MRVGIMVTNGGSHPVEKWAAQSASQIADVIVIAPDSIVFDSMTAAKTKFQDDLETALVDHHDVVHSHENQALKNDGAAHLDSTLDPEAEHLDEAVAAVSAVAEQTMFAAHFRKPEVQAFVRSTLKSHFSSVKHIERSWYADKNKGS